MERQIKGTKSSLFLWEKMITKQKVSNLIQDKLEENNCFVVELEIGEGNTISIEIDSLQGITVQDCMRFSRAVEDNIDGQREAFEAVTQEMTNLVEGNIATGKLYYQYCPMAFGNTGGHWLSNTKAIQNPYFGDKMLKCGRIDAEIN